MKRCNMTSNYLTIAAVLSLVGTGLCFGTTGGCAKDVVDSCCSVAAAQGYISCSPSCQGRADDSCCGWTPDPTGNPSITYTVVPTSPLSGREGVIDDGTESCKYSQLRCKNGNCGTVWYPGSSTICAKSHADPNGALCP